VCKSWDALVRVCYFNDTPPCDVYTLSLHDALPISLIAIVADCADDFFTRNHLERQAQIVGEPLLAGDRTGAALGLVLVIIHQDRSEEHTSELQSLRHLVCRLLLEKKKHSFVSTPIV